MFKKNKTSQSASTNANANVSMNIKQNKTLRTFLIIFVVCCLTSGIYLFANRSTKRLPTPEETAMAQTYAADFNALTGRGGAQKDIILSMCVQGENKQSRFEEYKSFTSTALSDYLYQCVEVKEILLADDGKLSVSYVALEDREVILVYDQDGLFELAVYTPANDTLYYQQGEKVEVWEKFRSGIQFGK